MGNIVISVENVSKQYRLGSIGTGSLAHDIHRWWYRIRGKEDPYLKVGEENDRTSKGSSQLVWALRDIDFKVEQGEVLGVIGRNGAGKSTLLKILSRTTTPTIGKIKVKGRIASLLEVGTGFHPELTGKENVFLNGAILGMTRMEIKRKFDEIVDFAGVERYIDTPVKRYSSGMYVRLAFAVAAHLESEVLIVDEVLAVGDVEFQKKCLGKMGDISKGEGRTVLFVSHNMGSIAQLCTKGIMLQNGSLVIADAIGPVTDYYINSSRNTSKKIENRINQTENHFSFVCMVDEQGNERSNYRFDECIQVRIEMYLPQSSEDFELAMRLVDKYSRAVFTIHEKLSQYAPDGSFYKFNITIPGKFLTPGGYSWVMCINQPGVRLFDLQEEVASFSVLETGSDFSRYEGHEYGCVFANYKIQSLT